MRFIFLFALLSASVISLFGCSQSESSAATSATIDQANICEVKAWQHDDVAQECKAGQKVVFLPESFGNEQLPILFAAVNCDLRFSVALTSGAVTCIYGPITPKQSEPPKQAAKKPVS